MLFHSSVVLRASRQLHGIRVLPWGAIWSIPTKTPVFFSQFWGKLYSSLTPTLSSFAHVSGTTFCLRSLLPYLLLVMAWSRVSLAFIMDSHQLCISASCGHPSSGLSSLTLWHLNFHMKCTLSDINIRFILLTCLRAFPSQLLNSISPHPAICPIFCSSGHNLCFLDHNCFVFFHTMFWPGISQWRRICSRSSVTPHFIHRSLCSKLGICAQ